MQRGKKHVRMTSDFLWKTMQATRQWINIFKVYREKICQPRIQKLARRKKNLSKMKVK